MEKNTDTVSLDDLFKFSFNAIKELEDLTPQDPKHAKTVEEAVSKLEQCTELVNKLHLFSVNEKVDEIATPVLKFLLLPALLGSLSSRKKDDRLLLVEQSEIYYCDFLKRCADYGLTKWKYEDDKNEEKESEKEAGAVAVRSNIAGPGSLETAARARNAKLERYREQQRLESLLSAVEESIDRGSAQEDEVREYYLNLIKFWCFKVIDDLSLAKQEKEILKHMRALPANARGGPGEKKKDEKPRRPFKPFIITKTAEQKKVYGAGYPALPVMSVDEFYDQKYGKDGKGESGPSSHCPGGHSLQKWAADPDANERELEQEASEKEDKITRDDPEELARMRNWDDWKDEHRRGEGNRKNMG